MPKTITGHHKGAARLVRPDWTWQDDAQCRGEDLMLFFGPDGERQPEREARERKAKEICAQCSVRTTCLDYAIATPEKYGVYGGLNEDERATERRRRMRKVNVGSAPEEEPEPEQTPEQERRQDAEDLLASGLRVDEVARRIGMTVPKVVALVGRAAA